LSKHSDRKAKDLITRCVDIIRSSIPIGLTVGFDAEHYRAINPNQRKKLGQPLLICMARAAEIAAAVLDEYRKGGETIEGINLIFDDSKGNATKMLKAWIDLKERHPRLGAIIPSIGFADDKFFYPIQAADLLANLTNRYYQRGPKSEAAERLLRKLLIPDPAFKFKYLANWVTAEQMDQAVRKHERLY